MLLNRYYISVSSKYKKEVELMPTEKLTQLLAQQALKQARLQQAFANLAQSPEMLEFLNFL